MGAGGHVLHQDEAHAGIRGQILDESGEGLQAAGRSGATPTMAKGCAGPGDSGSPAGRERGQPRLKARLAVAEHRDPDDVLGYRGDVGLGILRPVDLDQTGPGSDPVVLAEPVPHVPCRARIKTAGPADCRVQTVRRDEVAGMDPGGGHSGTGLARGELVLATLAELRDPHREYRDLEFAGAIG